jgi:hypothetical protein
VHKIRLCEEKNAGRQALRFNIEQGFGKEQVSLSDLSSSVRKLRGRIWSLKILI